MMGLENAMKILSEGSLPENIKYVIRCRNCGTSAIAEGREGRYVSDRDGDARVFDCPKCHREAWVTAQRERSSW